MSNRLPNKAARDRDALLRELGYRLLRSDGGHLIYGHDSQPNLVCAATPSDRRSWLNFLGVVRRRHPEAFRITKAPVTGRRQRKPRGARQPASLRFVGAAPVARALQLNTQPMRCTACARPWLSQTVVLGRPCPVCNETLVVDERPEEEAA